MRLLSSAAPERIVVVSGRIVHENRCHRVGAVGYVEYNRRYAQH